LELADEAKEMSETMHHFFHFTTVNVTRPANFAYRH
jgi:hypothetical protein